ncbi:MAG: MFS transporter, partial [Myxococcota bacterium]
MATTLRILYAFVFAAVAIEYVFLPYAFTARGLSPADIGLLFTGRTLVVVLLQPKLSELADRLQRHHSILKIAVCAQFLGAAALGFAPEFWSIAAVIWAQACFRAPIVPVIDSTTVRAVGPARYGNIRLWGSLGFGVCAALVGRLASDLNYDLAGELSLSLYIAVTAVGALSALALPHERRKPVERTEGPRGLYSRAFVVFIAWNSLHWMAIAAYNTFF